MSEFKGTKGEWIKRVRHGKKRSAIVVEILAENQPTSTIYECFISEDECDNSDCCNQEQHANAKLIACAPEMLEELIHLEDYITRSLTLSGCDAKSIDYILRNTRPLIKKATS